jgi:hypothetical protein
MVELELLGLHGDGEHLTLTDDDGRRYRLSIDDTLRAAVRRDRPHLETLRAAGESTLRPKEIQALMRAGASVEEVAEVSGLPADNVRRYEGPVVAERDWVVQRAQAQRVGHEHDAPRLGDLVVDRLAARGVDGASVRWDAVRRQGQPWEVVVTFVAAEREREARWQVDLAARSVHAVDDEARWLSETEVGPGTHPRRHLSPVGAGRAGVYDVEAGAARTGRARPDETGRDAAAGARQDAADAHAGAAPGGLEPPRPEAEPVIDRSETDTLLAELASHRGTRLELQPELEPLDEDGVGMWDAPGAHPAASRPEEAVDAHVLALPRRVPAEVASASSRRDDAVDEPGHVPALPAPSDEAADESPRRAEAAGDERSGRGGRRRRSTRRSVPSWDEIVFGARPE